MCVLAVPQFSSSPDKVSAEHAALPPTQTVYVWLLSNPGSGCGIIGAAPCENMS